MTTIQQLGDFNRFAQQFLEQEGHQIPLDVIFDRWHQKAVAEDDLARIRASAKDYEQGERGKPLEEFLSEFDSKKMLLQAPRDDCQEISRLWESA